MCRLPVIRIRAAAAKEAHKQLRSAALLANQVDSVRQRESLRWRLVTHVLSYASPAGWSSSTHGSYAVRFWNCYFDHVPNLYAMRVRQLNFSRCYLPGLDIATIRVDSVLRIPRVPVECPTSFQARQELRKVARASL